MSFSFNHNVLECSRIQSRKILTIMESNGRVFRPHGALMVFPCMGSVIHVTICPELRTARMRWGNFTLMFSAPILVIMVILPGLFEGFRMSISFTNSAGFILSLTYIPQVHAILNFIIQNTLKKHLDFLWPNLRMNSVPTLMPRGLAIPRRNSTWAPSSWRVRSPTHTIWAEQS